MPDLNSLPRPDGRSDAPPSRTSSANSGTSGLQHPQEFRPSPSAPLLPRNPSSQPLRSEGRRSLTALPANASEPHHPGGGELLSSDHRTPHLPVFRTTSPHSMAAPTAASMPAAHHHRAPSLGELHQELEQEQEAQVNRLLQMIRQQQLQLQQMRGLAAADGGASTAIDDSTPTSETSLSLSHPPGQRSPALHNPPRGSVDLSRQSSRRSRASSRGNASPAQRPTSTGLGGYGEISEHGWALATTRDEAAFYQAETQMLTRENQMLKIRIRELERQVADRDSTPPASTSSPLASVSRVTSGAPVPAPISEGSDKNP